MVVGTMKCAVIMALVRSAVPTRLWSRAVAELERWDHDPILDGCHHVTDQQRPLQRWLRRQAVVVRRKQSPVVAARGSGSMQGTISGSRCRKGKVDSSFASIFENNHLCTGRINRVHSGVELPSTHDM
jgi:hypothetical protein